MKVYMKGMGYVGGDNLNMRVCVLRVCACIPTGRYYQSGVLADTTRTGTRQMLPSKVESFLWQILPRERSVPHLLGHHSGSICP